MADADQGQDPTEPLPISKEGDISSFLEGLQEIGHYKIESFLQRGGMNFLYLGTDLRTHQAVAIKILLPKFASQKDVVDRFLREAEILSIVDHPNIVKMYSHGSWDHGYYIALEFITGGSLKQYIQDSPLSLKRALEMVLDISYAICHLHTHGIIHRDLKLENILVTDEGQIKVIDFGIAQLLALVKEEERSVFLHRTMGTPIYMSPEQRENPENVSYPSDIYSLGIIAYELVLGKFSHGHVHLSLMPKGLQKILTKALRPNRDERYQDIVDFIADLSEYLNSDALQKERKAGDRTSELFDNLQQTKKNLFPPAIPKWPALQIGLAAHVGAIQTSLYADFLQPTENTYAFLCGESTALDSDAIVSTSAIRGMARALLKKALPLNELISSLNQLLLDDPTSKPFNLYCLNLCPKEGKLRYISCGYGYLWRVTQEGRVCESLKNSNCRLKEEGFQFQETSSFFNQGDELLLYGGSEISPEMEEILRQGALQYWSLPPQQKAEKIIEKLKLLGRFSLEDTILKSNRLSFNVSCIKLV